MPLIDTHTHLQEDGFAGDLRETLDRAADAGVRRMCVVGIDRATSEAAVALAEAHPELFAVVGVQPNYVHQTAPDDRDRVRDLAAHPRVVAVGETGLDHYWDYAPHDLQEDWFRWHLELSRDCGKPFVVHCREAEADTVRVMTEFAGSLPRPQADGLPSGVMHSFAGDADTARAVLGPGPAPLLQRHGHPPQEQAAAWRSPRPAPRTGLLVETDCPYLVPTPKRGKIKRNEPAFVAHVAAKIAEARGLSPEELSDLTTANAVRLFGLSVGEPADD